MSQTKEDTLKNIITHFVKQYYIDATTSSPKNRYIIFNYFNYSELKVAGINSWVSSVSYETIETTDGEEQYYEDIVQLRIMLPKEAGLKEHKVVTNDHPVLKIAINGVFDTITITKEMAEYIIKIGEPLNKLI